MSEALRALAAIAASSIRPPPKLSVSEWSDRYRVLDSRSSAEPGPWRTSRTPYLREIMDAMGPNHPAETVVICSASQVGKSEALNNTAGYYIAHAPAPLMLVQPTDKAADRYSRQRITPLIEKSEALRELVADRKSRQSANKLDSKEFPGGVLFILGANSPVGLASSPIRVLLADEIDRWPKEIPGEGDPLAIVERRTATFHNRKLLKVSTPTVKGSSRIETEYARTDQRRYDVPCPFCGVFQVLEWRLVRWEPGKPETAAYECAACSERIPHYRKPWMLEHGEWTPADEDAADELRNALDVRRDPKAVGFHLSSLYSPWLSWAELAAKFRDAGKDRTKLRVFLNTLLGETWDIDDGESVDESDLLSRREAFGPDCPKAPELPEGIGVLTAGVDIQADRVEIEVVGWGLGEESWSVDYVVIAGDPSIPPKTRGGSELWQNLDAALSRKYKFANGVELGIAAACIDTGFQTLNAYQFVKPRQRRRVWGVKGKAGDRKLWPKTPTRRNKGNIDLFVIGIDAAKEATYARLRQTEPGPGFCHFPSSRAPDYFEQLTAEKLKTRYRRGFAVKFWSLPSGKRNEALDIRVYAMAALAGWRAGRNTIAGALDKIENGVEPENGQKRPKRRAGAARKKWLGRRDHWLG